jgi:uncharacterized membrane protein
MAHQSISRPDPVLYATPVRRSLYAMLVPFPVACLTGALLTDLAYWKTAEMMWANFSAWLVSAGAVLIVIVALVGIVDFFRRRGSRSRALRDPAFAGQLVVETRPVWPHVIGTILVIVIAIINMFVHTRDAWTSVVPLGLSLSALTVVVFIVTGWLGRSRSNRTRVGVTA